MIAWHPFVDDTNMIMLDLPTMNKQKREHSQIARCPKVPTNVSLASKGLLNHVRSPLNGVHFCHCIIVKIRGRPKEISVCVFILGPQLW